MDARRPAITAGTLLAVATVPAMLVAIGFVWFFAPIEAKMGVVQKIFYFHVPSAYAMYAATALCAGASAVYLVSRSDRADALAASAGSVAMVFCAIVLTSGPLWAQAAWGSWWTWEPRLTSVLALGLILAAYAALRRASDRSPGLARFAGALAVLGALDLPLIHLAVRKWRGNHPTVVGRDGGGINHDMAVTLIVCFAAFTVLWVALVALRYRLEVSRREVARMASAAALGEPDSRAKEASCPAKP